jgi:hypothetical protein
MNLFNKLKWVLIVGVVFTLVLATNLIDRRSFRNINDSIISIYEDRLVVKNVILDMATAINKKEVAFLTLDTAFLVTNNESLTQALEEDLQAFEETMLLRREEESLDLLRKNMALMLNAEEELMKSQFADLENYKQVIRQVNENLDVLAHIQMQEGKRDVIRSKQNLDTVELFTRLEVYFLIFLAVVALLIIIYKPKT